VDIAIGADQSRELDPLAADIPHKIAEDRERSDGAWTILRLVLPPPRDKACRRSDSGRGSSQGNDMAPGRQSHSSLIAAGTDGGAKAA
jgi:hypothetical protein